MGTIGAKIGPPSSSLTPPPAPLGPPSQVSPNGGGSNSAPNLGGGPPNSLEMLLVERAKAIQQANPTLKAFADMQGEFFCYLLKYTTV